MVRIGSALTALVAAVALVVAAPAAMASSPGDEAGFVDRINALRAEQGLEALRVDGPLASTACAWNDVMIADGHISHDPDLVGAIESATSNWRKGGENVGMGGGVDSLFRAFVNSPTHYRNLVDPDFDRIGVCVTYSPDGVMFTTHRFVASARQATTTTVAPEPAPEPEPSPAPAPTAPAAPAPTTAPAQAATTTAAARGAAAAAPAPTTATATATTAATPDDARAVPGAPPRVPTPAGLLLTRVF